jgi:lysozyme
VKHKRLRDRLIGHEGLRLVVYDDKTGEPLRPGMVVKGNPTIGFGRALNVNGISMAEAHYLLDNDITRATKDAQNFSWFWELNDARQEVVIEMLFNLGLRDFVGFKRMIAAIQRKDYESAADEMTLSRWAKQVGDRDLVLCQMMRSGKFPEEDENRQR